MNYNFKESSNWNIQTELRCLLIYKELEELGFPSKKQAELCKKMASETNLSYGNISAKVSNYKTVAGVNNDSNASSATKSLYEKYGNFSLKELKILYEGVQLGLKNK